MATDIETPLGIAETFAEGARYNYERDGRVEPILAVLSDKQELIIQLAMCEDLPMAYGQVVGLVAGKLQPHTFVTVTETWMQSRHTKAATPEEMAAEAASIKRGDLGRLAAAGDPTVHTALASIAWRLDPNESAAVFDVVGDDGTYEHEVFVGTRNDGHMSDCVYLGWKYGLENPPPPDLPLELLINMIGSLDLVVTIAMLAD